MRLSAMLVCVTLPLLVGCGAEPGAGALPTLPDATPKQRKQAFFDYLRPIVAHENGKILGEREWLLRAAQRERLGWWDTRRWQRLAARYRVSLDAPHDEVAARLLRRVDVVPESLVLAQAAKESGWGRSRFAREGNALFGERCFVAGCGMLPAARVSGARHEVERFATVAETVESYLLNLNTHERYTALRLERQKLNEAGLWVSGSALARFAAPYSERREEYVNEVIQLIAYNHLEREPG